MKPQSLFVFAAALALTAPVSQSATPGAKDAKPDTPTRPTEIYGSRFDMRSTDKETKAVFDGNVIVTGTNLKLTCDHLEVVASRIGDLKAAAAKLDKFRSLIATGRVRIVQGDREVTCGRAEVFPAEERILLRESPVVVDHGSSLVVTGRWLELRRGESQVGGEDVKIVGPDIDDLGYDKKKASKEAASTPAKSATTPAP